MESKLIGSQVLLRLGKLVLLTAEGRRRFEWHDVPEERGYVGTRVAAVEHRWVTYRLLGRLPVWMAHDRHVELHLTNTIAMFALTGVHHYDGLDARFAHPLCKVGHDWLGTGQSPGMLQGMSLSELTEQGWTV